MPPKYAADLHDCINCMKWPVFYSAGVGRTGTFIALDVLIQQLQNEDIVDVFAIVYQMRMSRVLMVQTEVTFQYNYRIGLLTYLLTACFLCS